MSKVKVWTNGTEIEAEREICVFTDRSRICDRKRCERLWWHRYKSGPEGRGIVSTFESEDLVMGRAVHDGLKRVIESGAGIQSLTMLGQVAACEMVMEVFEAGDLLIQGDSALATVAPDLARLLAEEQAWLAYALVWTFERRHLGPLLDQYEIVALEEEIPWLLGWTHDGRPIVMMSRLDGVVRRRSDGRLLVMEHKTKKEFDRETLEDLQIDEQGAAQMLAVAERYGEMPAGVLYFYFLKGEKREDKDIGYKRYGNGLIRPYCNHNGYGEVAASNFAIDYYFEKGDGSRGALGKGWKRRDMWAEGEIGVEAWLEMLDGGEVTPHLERDYLAEAIACPEVVEWTDEALEEWRRGAVIHERRFADAGIGDTVKRSEGCRTFRTPCSYRGICWDGQTAEDLLVEGRMTERVPNHPMEFGEEGGNAKV